MEANCHEQGKPQDRPGKMVSKNRTHGLRFSWSLVTGGRLSRLPWLTANRNPAFVLSGVLLFATQEVSPVKGA